MLNMVWREGFEAKANKEKKKKKKKKKKNEDQFYKFTYKGRFLNISYV